MFFYLEENLRSIFTDLVNVFKDCDNRNKETFYLFNQMICL